MNATGCSIGRRRFEAGITLLEMLITLALLSLLTLGLFGSLRYGNRIWQVTDAKANAIDNIRSAQSRLSRLITSTYPQLSSADPLRPAVRFSGDASRVQFLAPDETSPGALSETTVRVDPSGSGLLLSYAQDLELRNESLPTSRAHLLAGGFARLQIDYFGTPARRGKTGWYSTWRGATRLPTLIRFRGEFLNAAMKWPELVIAPRIAADMTCRFDSANQFCQGR
jgi:general secretion pathway protein J